ncbi:MAG: glycoside hydrolase family 5 protein [Verrucomicrobia bacterium]|nr:glycoside hydrolase family 5 protein [Verrucomicrobiota bacterium]
MMHRWPLLFLLTCALPLHAQGLLFFSVEGTNIVDDTGSVVFLRGATFGCWLLWEGGGYGLPNPSEHILRKELESRMGTNETAWFFGLIRDAYFQPDDFDHARSLGFHFIRLPFHYRYVDTNQFTLLDQAVNWARSNAVYVLLDLHAAPGSQNTAWHSDSDGAAHLWESSTNQEEFIELWRTLALRYRNESCVLGYELLNEPAAPSSTNLTDLYARGIAAIRAADPRHIIFLDGNNYASDFGGFHPPSLGSNLVYVFHEYSTIEQVGSNLANYTAFRNEFQVPIMCNEYGGEAEGAEPLFRSNGIPWVPWQYKLVPVLPPDAMLYSMPTGSSWRTWLTDIDETLSANRTNTMQQMTAVATNSTLTPPCLSELTNRIALHGQFDGHDLRFLAAVYPDDSHELRRIWMDCEEIALSNNCDAISSNWLALTSAEKTNVTAALQTRYWQVVDSDADGMPDIWESNYTGGLLDLTDLSDYDGDRFLDPWEYLAETDPTNGASYLGMVSLLSTSPAASDGIPICWSSSIHKRYRLVQSTDLRVGFNSTCTSNILATPPVNVYTSRVISGMGRLCFRIELEQGD